MAKSSGSGGRGNNGYDFGKGVTTKSLGDTNLRDGEVSSFVDSTGTRRIVVAGISSGSDRQNEYANTLKIEAMKTIDRAYGNFISKGANRERTTRWRNSVLSRLNSEKNANSFINNFKLISRDAGAITRYYGINP